MNKHKLLSFLLVLALIFTSFSVPQTSDAAKKPKLSKKRVTVYVGKTKKIKIKNASKKAKVKWKLGKNTKRKKKLKIVKKKTKGKKAYVKIKGLKKGKGILKAIYKVPGKKKKILKCRVAIKKAKSSDVATDSGLGVATGTPAASTVPGGKTAAPTATAPGGKATATPKPTATPKGPTATPRITPTPTS